MLNHWHYLTHKKMYCMLSATENTIGSATENTLGSATETNIGDATENTN